ncbi:MAG: hypothetical protein HY606_00345 [Planctomycetes bacterium]|nr:hypothetical protein [Planctomycetota bacterium]
MKPVLIKITALPNLFVMVILTSISVNCSTRVETKPFIDEMRVEYEDRRLPDFQYYLSKDVTLRKVESAKKVGVEEGIGSESSKKFIKEIKINSRTRGELSLNRIKGEVLYISFDPNDEDGLPFVKKEVELNSIEEKKNLLNKITGALDFSSYFGPLFGSDEKEKEQNGEKDQSNQKKQKVWLYVISPQKGNIVMYGGDEYVVTEESLGAFLLTDVAPEKELQKQVKYLPGRKYYEKEQKIGTRPFIDEIRVKYEDKRLPDFQYYLSKDIALKRIVEPDKTIDVEKGIGKESSQAVIKEIHINSKTSGELSLNRIKGDVLYISFDTNDEDGLPFVKKEVDLSSIMFEENKKEQKGDLNNQKGQAQQEEQKVWLYMIQPQEGNAVKYRGEEYVLTDESLGAFLLIDIAPEAKLRKKIEYLTGRKYYEKERKEETGK